MVLPLGMFCTLPVTSGVAGPGSSSNSPIVLFMEGLVTFNDCHIEIEANFAM